MNTELEAGAPAPSSTLAAISPAQQLKWLLRREVGEYCSIWIAPAVAAVVALLGHLVATIGRASFITEDLPRREMLQHPPGFIALVIMGVTFVVAVFYCIDTLYGERRDRSILFWKSLPVSDRMTVFAKLLVPTLIIPAVGFVVLLVTQLLALLLSSVALAMNGFEVAPLWQRAAYFTNGGAMLFHLVAIHGLWYAPIYAWFLLVSAWAKRVPFLWAFLPPAVLVAVEKLEFGTFYIGDFLHHRFSGGPQGEMYTADAIHHGHFAPLEFLFSPGLWVGLALAAGLVLLAARIRGEREPG